MKHLLNNKIKYSKAAAGTFQLNKQECIHRWYAYLEGYSSCLIDDLINEVGINNIKTIYDPFCGTGTTLLVASKYGIKSYYSETNPFMKMVIEAKINSVKRLRDNGISSSNLKKFLKHIKGYQKSLFLDKIDWNGFEKFFDNDVLHQLLDIKSEIKKIRDCDSQKILLVLLASVTVKASKMIRQGDLRLAKPFEKKENDKNIIANFIKKIEEAIEDIESSNSSTFAETVCISDDARDIVSENSIDCIITSPPYLNGTNYIRNTKLELKLTDFVKTEKDLPLFHSKGIVAGINNVSKRKSNIESLEIVKPYIEALQPITYDKRIPTMISGYFYDMDCVIKKLSIALKNNGIFIMDIGDSQFAGIHIPTHEILTKICQKYGFKLYSEDILRKRYSKNGMMLSQRLLKFKLNKDHVKTDEFKIKAKKFIENVPYHQEPYSGRNWGHTWHSLCSYHGKLKPAIAHFMIQEFTKPGDIVLDPLSGVGTIPFEACIQGRIGIGNDLSELAYIVTKAKLEKTNLEDCLNVLAELECYINKLQNSQEIKTIHQKYVDFGFNGKVSEYFHPNTFYEILCARKFFTEKFSTLSSEEAMVFSCLLHILHGNRPYALSRTSHPLTPYKPTGEFIYKNIIQHIKHKLNLAFKKGDFDNYQKGKVFFGNYTDLKYKKILVDTIITSPPFADSIKFYLQNWMRLWLCGWEPENYKNAENIFLDQKQKKDFNVYTSFFDMCSSVLKPNGKIILHLGKTEHVDMAEELSKRAEPYFSEIYRGSEDVQLIEKHGIKDKGGTLEHQYLFLRKK